MKSITIAIFLVFTPIFTFATGISWAKIRIHPVAEVESGHVICKWGYRLNPEGAGIDAPIHIGWLIASSSGIELEIQTDTLFDQGYQSENEQIKAEFIEFTEIPTVEDIPVEIRNMVKLPIKIIDTTSFQTLSYHHRYNTPVFDTIVTKKEFYSIKSLFASRQANADIKEVVPYYSNYGISLYRTHSELQSEGLIWGAWFLSEYSEVQKLLGNSTGYVTFEEFDVDAFIFQAHD